MAKNMDITDILVSDLAEIFVWYVNNTELEVLKATYINDIVDDEESENSIGKFRLIHIYKDKDEYITFVARFNKVENFEELSVSCIGKKETIIECTRNPESGAWSPNINYQNISLFDLTKASSKLRGLL